jgi:TM2 domain-containing membrane protein YozV
MHYIRIFLFVLLALAGFQLSLTSRNQPLPVEPLALEKSMPAWKAKIYAKIGLKQQKKAAPRAQDYKIRTQMSAFLLCLFFGFLGLHRFYTGHYVIGLLQLMTFGCCGFFWIVDLLLIAFNLLPTAWGEKLVSWNYTALDDKQKTPLRLD